MEAHAAQKVCRHHNAQKLKESWANGACSHGSASSRSTHFSTSTTGRMAGPPTGKLIYHTRKSGCRSSPQKLSRSTNRHRNEEAGIALLQAGLSPFIARTLIGCAASSTNGSRCHWQLQPGPGSGRRYSICCLLAVWQDRGLGRVTPIVTMMSGAPPENCCVTLPGQRP